MIGKKNRYRSYILVPLLDVFEHHLSVFARGLEVEFNKKDLKRHPDGYLALHHRAKIECRTPAKNIQSGEYAGLLRGQGDVKHIRMHAKLFALIKP
ncbi:hypothetical protein HYW58_00710 [Candidatus Kaiserbacteria bacterium]|nr:hypothetical protein [Candidatus Kaiserbacteria bacterium]